MLARQTFRSTSALLAATAIGGGLAYTGISQYSTKPSSSSILQSAYADAPPIGPKKVFPGSGFTELKLDSAEVINHNVKRLRFRLPDEEAVTGLEPISSLLTKHTPTGAWIPVIRPYTPVIVDEPGFVTFMIKKYPNGRASGHLHSMQPGDSLSFRVLSEFPYTANQFSHITLIAGGSGITPIYQLVRTVFQNPADKTKLTLVYAANTEADILLRNEFDDFQTQFPDRFKTVYAASKATANGGATPAERGGIYSGYLTTDILKAAMPDSKQGAKVKVLVSGPPPMTAAIAGAKGGLGWTQGSLGGILQELGWQKDQVFKF